MFTHILSKKAGNDPGGRCLIQDMKLYRDKTLGHVKQTYILSYLGTQTWPKTPYRKKFNPIFSRRDENRNIPTRRIYLLCSVFIYTTSIHTRLLNNTLHAKWLFFILKWTMFASLLGQTSPNGENPVHRSLRHSPTKTWAIYTDKYLTGFTDSSANILGKLKTTSLKYSLGGGGGGGATLHHYIYLAKTHSRGPLY